MQPLRSSSQKRSTSSSTATRPAQSPAPSPTPPSHSSPVSPFKKEEATPPLRDGREYSSLLNACARMRRPSLGIGICLGDRGEAMREAELTVDESHRRIIG